MGRSLAYFTRALGVSLLDHLCHLEEVLDDVLALKGGRWLASRGCQAVRVSFVSLPRGRRTITRQTDSTSAFILTLPSLSELTPPAPTPSTCLA